MKQSLKIGDKVKTKTGNIGTIVRDGLIIFDWMVHFDTLYGGTDEPYFDNDLTLANEDN